MSNDKTQWENTILETLEDCITKMSDKLKETYDPGIESSRDLFKQFCAALSARQKWIKATTNKDAILPAMTASIREIVKSKKRLNKDVKDQMIDDYVNGLPNKNNNPSLDSKKSKNGLLIR
jgi:ribosomal protein S19